MTVLALIPCLNEEAHIGPLVAYLLRESQSCPLHIVIADGGSTDRTAEIAKKLAAEHANVTYMHNPKRLQGAAINAGVGLYGGEAEFFIRIDAHAEYPEGYCAALLNEARSHNADSVVVSMDTQGKTDFQRAVAATQNSKLGNGGSAHRLAAKDGKWVDHGHHALMRVTAFKHVGGYDESFSHNEDAELDARLAKAGFKIWLTGKTNLIYYPRPSPGALFKQYRQYGRGRIRTIMKHKTKPKLRQMLPVAVFPSAVLALLAPLCWVAAAPLLLWAALCLGYGVKIARAAKDKAVYMAGPAAMIMHFSWSLGFWQGLAQPLTKGKA